MLDRIADILGAIGENPDGVALSQAAKRTGLHKSSAHRLLSAMRTHGFVDKSDADGKYRLGLKLFELGSMVARQMDIRERARPYLERLVATSGETAHLCILAGTDTLYVEKVEPERTVRIPSAIGSRIPAYCSAAGKAMLASLPLGELEVVAARISLQRFTANTITGLEALRQELDATRKRGFSIDDEEFEPGLKGVAAPLRRTGGDVIAAISIVGPAFRLGADQIRKIADQVIGAASELASEFGFRPEMAARAREAKLIKGEKWPEKRPINSGGF
ncbi:MAG: IclR family transcriptional regulator [Candidatus Binataceae bacterium]